MNESKIKQLLDDAKVDEAVDAALTLYGNKIFGYLVNVSDHDTASELFQKFSLDLWRGLPRFQWRSSLQTWSFTLARRAWLQHIRSPRNKRDVRLVTEDGNRIENRARTMTEEWRKTAARDALTDAMDQLEPDARELLNLRIQQKMGWKEIAALLHEGDEPLEGKALSNASVTVRKRFQRVKDRLRKHLKPLAQDDP